MIPIEVDLWLWELTQTLLPQRNTLQLIQPVFLRRAIDNCILQQLAINAVMIHCALHASCASFARLQLPCVSSLVVYESWIIVAFVEVFEDRGEDLGLFIWKGDSLGCRFHELSAACGLEEGRYAEDVFVCGEKSLLLTHNECDYR
jgi:hypothetical protein